MERTHLAAVDLDWLPPSLRSLRSGVRGLTWVGLGVAGAVTAIFAKGMAWLMIAKGGPAVVAGGYLAGNRAARAVVQRRLTRWARGRAEPNRLAERDDGDLVHVRGTIRAMEHVDGLLTPVAAVYRRVVFAIDGVHVVHEAACDFALVDATGAWITIVVDGARVVAPEPKRKKLAPEPAQPAQRLIDLPLPSDARTKVNARAAARPDRRSELRAGELLIRDGDQVDVVGYKDRTIDLSVDHRLARDLPTRASLRSGHDLPLLIAPVGRA